MSNETLGRSHSYVFKSRSKLRQTMSENLKDYGISDTRRFKIESWFDEHPMPYDIDILTLKYSMMNIEIFYCDGLEDDFMVKITCNNARLAVTLSKTLMLLTSSIGIEQILINKKLFLLRRSKHFFQC